MALPSGPMHTPVEFKTFGRSKNTIFDATMPTRGPAIPQRYAPRRLEGDVDPRRANRLLMHDIFFASGGIPGRGDGRSRINGPSETKVVNSPVVDNGGVRVVEAAACPLCGASGRVRYSQLRDRSWSAPGTWSFRECVACGHLWLDPCPIAEEIGRLYASYYTHGVERGSPLQGDGFWPRCRRGVLEAYGYRGLAHDSTERFLGQVMRFVPPVWEGAKRPSLPCRVPLAVA